MKMDENAFDAGAGAVPALAGLVVPLLKGVMYQENDAGQYANR